MIMWTAMKNCRKCYRAKYATFVVWEKKTGTRAAGVWRGVFSFLMDLSHFYVILDYAIALSNTALIKAFVCS